MNEHRKKIGRQIAELREQKKMTQEELANITSLDRANISKVENGRYNISIDILQRICNALGASIKLQP